MENQETEIRIKKRLKLIDDTVEYFTKNPRGVSYKGGGCAYINKKGDKCAIGILFSDEDAIFLEKIGTVIEEVGYEIKNHYEYQGEQSNRILKTLGEQPMGFWANLQTFHDRNSHWDENGLTEQGKSYHKYLKERWGNAKC